MLSRPGLRTLRAGAHADWAAATVACVLKGWGRGVFALADLTCQCPCQGEAFVGLTLEKIIDRLEMNEMVVPPMRC